MSDGSDSLLGIKKEKNYMSKTYKKYEFFKQIKHSA